MTENYMQYASDYQKDNIDEIDIAKTIFALVGVLAKRHQQEKFNFVLYQFIRMFV